MPRKKGPNWKKIAKGLQLEIEELREKLSQQTASLAEMKRCGWDERSKVKLRAFEHFYSRILNVPTKCTEDREYLDKLVEEVQYAIKSGFEKGRTPP